MTRRPNKSNIAKSGSANAHSLRVIGGVWRGRKLDFPAIDVIRPTPNRIRETVFNWLQHDISGARCLDLFAGSGALGIEALSRGAAHVTFVDREPKIARYLRETLSILQAQNYEVHVADSMDWLRGSALPFDIVFLDPPFASDALSAIFHLLDDRGWLASPSLVYIECPSDAGTPSIPRTWTLIKSKTTGQVGYHLARSRSQ